MILPAPGAIAAATVASLVRQITGMFSTAGVRDPGAEARDLVAAVAGERRFWPLTHADTLVAPALEERALLAASNRASGMPFAYAVGKAAFRHLTLSVNQHVLIPRQETEVLVDLVLARRRTGSCVEVGTGSGAVALALAAEGNFHTLVATDISRDALSVARHNAAVLSNSAGVRIDFRCGDLLTPVARETFDVLVSNPPYIAFEEAGELPSSVRDWEPGHALFSAGHGLDVSRRIVEGAASVLSGGGLLALEVDSRRAVQVAELVEARGCFEQVEVYQDLAGRDRFVLAVRSA